MKLIPLSPKEAPPPVINDQPGINGAPDPRICSSKDQEYRGIGIIHSFVTQIVESAPAEYPAYKAGIRVGDQIMEIYRLPGTQYMMVYVNRDRKSLKFKVKMEKICFNKNG